MEPLSTATLLAVAGKLGPPTAQVLGTHLLARLSPDEEKRLSKALAEVVLESSSGQRPSTVRHPIKSARFRKSRKRIEKQARPVASPSALMPTSAPTGDDGNPLEQATVSWRDQLAERFRDTASAGLAENPADWRLILGPMEPADWGAAAQSALEWRMAADPKLRTLLARLDWGNEQASREGAAFASLAYLRVIPVALGLTFGIFVSLAAIAVILAVDLT